MEKLVMARSGGAGSSRRPAPAILDRSLAPGVQVKIPAALQREMAAYVAKNWREPFSRVGVVRAMIELAFNAIDTGGPLERMPEEFWDDSPRRLLQLETWMADRVRELASRQDLSVSEAIQGLVWTGIRAWKSGARLP